MRSGMVAIRRVLLVAVLAAIPCLMPAGASASGLSSTPLGRALHARCGKPHGSWARVCALLERPAGSVALPGPRHLADRFSLTGASPQVCARLGSHWVFGTEVGRRFVTDARYATDYARAMPLLANALRVQARSLHAIYRALGAVDHAYCQPLRFRFAHARAATLPLVSRRGRVAHTAEAGTSALDSTLTNLGVVTQSGQDLPAVASGNAQVSNVSVEPDGDVLVQFLNPTSLTGPMAEPTPKQLCYVAQVDAASGVPTCVADGDLYTDWPDNSSVPPFGYGSDGAVYFTASSPGSPDRLSWYQFKDETTVDLTPQPSEQTSAAYPAPPTPLSDGQLLLATPDPNVDSGPPDNGLWLLTPQTASPGFTETQITTPSGWRGSAWALPNGNVFATGFLLNSDGTPAPTVTSGKICPLMQITIPTGQLDPTSCSEFPSDSTILALAAAVSGYDPKLLTTAGGQDWVIGNGEMAELYPSVSLFPAPNEEVIDGDETIGGPYRAYVAGNELVLTTAYGTSGPAVFAFDTTTLQWSELLGPDPDADGPLPSGVTVSAVTVDSADNSLLLTGAFSTGSPWAVNINLSSRKVIPLVDTTLNAPASDAYGYTVPYMQYDPTTDTLNYASILGWSPAVGGPPPAAASVDTVAIDVATGTARRASFTIPTGGDWPPTLIPLVPSSTILGGLDYTQWP